MADWDQNSPEDSDIVSQYPANARAARAAVRSNFGVDHREQNDDDVGKHEVIHLVDQEGDATIAAGQVGIWNDGGELRTRSAGGAVSTLGFASGTRMLFHQATAPAGWTQATNVNDRVLRVVSGAGGGTGGSWTISGVTVNGHSLTIAQMPSHNHGGTTGNRAPSTNTAGNHSHTTQAIRHNRSGLNTSTARFAEAGSSSQATQQWPSNTAGNHSHTVASHNHAISSQGSGSAHSHGLTSNGSWRPSYTDVIVAEKD